MAQVTRRFSVPKLRVRFVRGLRFRLAVSYVAFFALLLAVIGLLFRQNLKFQLDSEDRDALEESWSVAKSYVRIENFRPRWLADTTDPDENYVVERVRHVYLMTDANGYVLQISTAYENLGPDSPAEVRRILALPTPEIHVRADKDGVPYWRDWGRRHTD